MRYYIVDDNIATLKTLQNIIKIRELGCVVGCSTDPENALIEILEDKPDIVLVDLLMSGIDGITLVSRIREKDTSISFVMISKVSDKEMVQRAYTAGIEFFINKPINITEIETVLKNVSESIRMRDIMGSIKNIFDAGSKTPNAPSEAPKKRHNDCDILLGALGMLGEKGVQDIRLIYSMITEEGTGYDRTHLERAAKEQNDTVRNVEQRIRRAIKKGMVNAATAGIEDYGSEIFTVYAGYVFDFRTLRDEMNYQVGKSSFGGRVSISKFMEGLILYHKSV